MFKHLMPVLVLVWAGAAPARAEETRYILAPSVIQADPAPRVFRGEAELEALSAVFRTTFEAEFPGGAKPLSVEHPLDPDEPTVLVVPRLSAVRLNLDKVAGSLERYEAMIVGDITLMDPWTLTRLFAATRMVTRTVELSSSRSPSEKLDFLRKAFREAAEGWLRDCLAELKKGAHPFTLKGAILDAPGISVKGGVWPFGSRQGVKAHTIVMASTGKTARVKELFEHFCVVEDPADPSRRLKGDEVYRVTLMGSDTPAERAEPRVAIRWVGLPPASPAETDQGLDAAGWGGLLANYLSKDGRFRLLPLTSEKDAEAWKRMADKLRTFSLKANAIATQDIAVLMAAEDPDLVVELGLINAYHGRAAAENGATDHAFRAQWGLRWFERDAERNVLIFKGAEFLPEQTAVRTKPGLRELDLASVWFNLCRNGLIRLAEQVSKRMKPGESLVRGTGQGGGKITWSGAPPPAAARLTWRRNQGTVMAGGKVLGPYLTKAQALKAEELAKVGKGDEVVYDPGASGSLAGFLPVDLPSSPLPLESPWIQARLAQALIKATNVDLVFAEAPSAELPQWLRLKVDTVTAETTPDALKLGAAWRLRLYRGAYDPSAEPAFKLGLLQPLAVPLDAAMRPPDGGTAALALQAVALEELSKRAIMQGLPKALSQGD